MSYDPTTKTERTRYFVSWFGFRWHFRKEGRITLETFKTKEEAVALARAYLGQNWKVGHRSELTIRTKLGIFKQKETYGDDPPATKG